MSIVRTQIMNEVIKTQRQADMAASRTAAMPDLPSVRRESLKDISILISKIKALEWVLELKGMQE